MVNFLVALRRKLNLKFPTFHFVYRDILKGRVIEIGFKFFGTKQETMKWR